MIKKWKIGDKCWCKVCCGPEFKILDITHGYAIIDHAPPVAVSIENLYSSKGEFLEEELKDLLEERKRVEERIKEKKEEIKKECK